MGVIPAKLVATTVKAYVLNSEGMMPKISQAQHFADYVKTRGGLPRIKDELEVYKQFGADELDFALTTGHFKLVYVGFEDGSWYERGEVFD